MGWKDRCSCYIVITWKATTGKYLASEANCQGYYKLLILLNCLGDQALHFIRRSRKCSSSGRITPYLSIKIRCPVLYFILSYSVNETLKKRLYAPFSINLLVVYRESVNLIGYITRRLSADSLQL